MSKLTQTEKQSAPDKRRYLDFGPRTMRIEFAVTRIFRYLSRFSATV